MTTKLWRGNNLDVLPNLNAFVEPFHCVVTSPPYKDKDGYSLDDLVKLHFLIGKKMVPGGRYFLNFGQLKENFSRPFELQQALASTAPESGLIPSQTFIWVKSLVIDGAQRGHFQAISSPRFLNYCYEFVFSFFKPLPDGKERPLDRLSSGVAYADKSNLSRGTRGKNGDVHCAGDVWFIPYQTTGKSKKKKHEYEFPEALVEKCLKIAGLEPGETVLDPFAGSGPVGRVANRLGYNAILIERDGDKIARCIEHGAVLQPTPADVWESLPTDLSSNVDHYLYGDEKSF